MKYVTRYACIFLLFALLLLITGCVNRFTGTEPEQNTGTPISPEDIESIFEAISKPAVDKYPTETDSNGELIVYWTESGSVWHSSLSCGSVSKSDPNKLKSGSIMDALVAGKERACKVCSSDSEVDFSFLESDNISDIESIDIEHTQYTKEYDSEGELIVHWLNNGSVWHESSRCDIILNAQAEEVFSGSPDEAFASGKDRACKICSLDSKVTIEINEVTTGHVGATEEVDKYPKEYDANGYLIVFWLSNGTVWHESARCSSVINASAGSLFSGTPSEASLAGKERACKICAADSQVIVETYQATTDFVESSESRDKYEKEYDEEGNLIVFWLDSGTVWHESINCPALSGSSADRIISGSILDAIYSKKERACKRCSE